MQLFARLGKRPSLESIEESIFPGGIGTNDVIEVYGEDGVGKTQLLLHLVANCILPKSLEDVEIGGLECGVVFIDADYQLSMIRLVSLMEARIHSIKRGNGDKLKHIKVEQTIQTCLERLHIIKCNNSSELVLSLFSVETLLASKPNISIMMIDSISAFYYMDRGIGEGNSHQEANQRNVAKAIEKLTSSFKIAVMVSKLALFKKRGKTSDLDRSPYFQDRSAESTTMVPEEHSEYLCSEWQKLVTHRLVLQKKNIPQTSEMRFSLSFKAVTGQQQKRTKDFTIYDKGLSFSTDN